MLPLQGESMIDHTKRLLHVAARWQDYYNRDLDSIVGKIIEEAGEYVEATEQSSYLDELGDVLVNAMRALVRMTPKQREFVVRVMEMKVSRRLDDPGVKNKIEEAKITAKLAVDLLG